MNKLGKTVIKCLSPNKTLGLMSARTKGDRTARQVMNQDEGDEEDETLL